jgi:hypothetical protein
LFFLPLLGGVFISSRPGTSITTHVCLDITILREPEKTKEGGDQLALTNRVLSTAVANHVPPLAIHHHVHPDHDGPIPPWTPIPLRIIGARWAWKGPIDRFLISSMARCHRNPIPIRATPYFDSQ